MNKEIEEILKDIKDKYSYEPYDDTGNVYTTISYEEGQLLLSYIKELKEDNEYLKRLCETQNNREYRSKFLKEFQKEKGENVFPDYDEIYKRYDNLKEKIEQLQSNWNSLREYIQEEIITSKNIGDQHWFYYQIVLDKMNELEKSDTIE